MLGYILTYFSLGNGETLIVLGSQQRDISLPTSTVRHFWTSAEKKLYVSKPVLSILSNALKVENR